MIIACPRERKVEEFRVALTPAYAAQLVAAGHQVRIETQAGTGAGFSDADYLAAGVEVVSDAAKIYSTDLVIKVKEPIREEYGLLRQETLLFCYLHLAAVPELADALVGRNVTSVAFETITAPDGSLPLLQPMSIVAGRLAVQVGATALQKDHGGKGLLLAGLPGVRQGHVVIIGGGTVGVSAMQMAIGLGARVTVLDVNPRVLHHLDTHYHGRITTLMASHANLAAAVSEADLLIGAVLVPGARAPRIVSREMVGTMEPGSVIVDVAVDQGGCVETTHPTTHDAPTYVEEGVVHYAVTNMPALTARTSTLGLADATFPVLRRLAQDAAEAFEDPHIREGLTTRGGKIVHPRVAEALNNR